MVVRHLLLWLRMMPLGLMVFMFFCLANVVEVNAMSVTGGDNFNHHNYANDESIRNNYHYKDNSNLYSFVESDIIEANTHIEVDYNVIVADNNTISNASIVHDCISSCNNISTSEDTIDERAIDIDERIYPMETDNDHPTTTINSPIDTPPPLSCDEVYHRLQTESLPMLEFSHELDRVLRTSRSRDDSLLDAYNLFNHYIDLLRDYYYEVFTEQCQECITKEQCKVVGERVLKECAAAMRGSVPSSMISTESPSGQTAISSDGYDWSIQVQLAVNDDSSGGNDDGNVDNADNNGCASFSLIT